jgi:hypothetical protein
MRFLLTLFCALVTTTLLALDQPEKARAIAAKVGNTVHGWWTDKEVWVSGTSLVARKDIDDVLPNQQSVLWWMVNGEQIESALRGNPLIAKADVQRCPNKWWGCFSIAIEEREPKFLLLVGSKGWLVGGDGGILTPLPAQRAQAILRGESPPEFMGKLVPLVEGPAAEEESPDLVKNRLGLAKRAIEILSEELPASGRGTESGDIQEVAPFIVERLSFRQKHDMRVRFREWPFVVTFGIPQSEGWEAVLRDQCARLRRLLDELGDAAMRAKEIDLAFDSVAVVRPSVLSKVPALPMEPVPVKDSGLGSKAGVTHGAGITRPAPEKPRRSH